MKISSFYDPPVQNGDLVPQVVVGGSMVEVAALGQGQGSGAGDAGAGGRPASSLYKRLRGPGRARPTRRRRRLGRPRGRLAVYFSRSRSGLRKPPSSGANIKKGCVTKYSIKLRAGQNKNKARARPASPSPIIKSLSCGSRYQRGSFESESSYQSSLPKRRAKIQTP